VEVSGGVAFCAFPAILVRLRGRREGGRGVMMRSVQGGTKKIEKKQ